MNIINDIRTIKTMKEGIKEYFDPGSIKIMVVAQRKQSYRIDDTIMESVLTMNDACMLFGDYEMMLSNIDTYEEEDYKFPCIKCIIYIPGEVNE